MGDGVATVPVPDQHRVVAKSKHWEWGVFSAGAISPSFRNEARKAQVREQSLCETCVNGICRFSKRPDKVKGDVMVFFVNNPTDAIAILDRLEGIMGEDFRTHRNEISKQVHETVNAIIVNRLAFLDIYNKEMSAAIGKNSAVVQMIMSFSRQLSDAYKKVSDQLLADIEENRRKERDSLA